MGLGWGGVWQPPPAPGVKDQCFCPTIPAGSEHCPIHPLLRVCLALSCRLFAAAGTLPLVPGLARLLCGVDVDPRPAFFTGLCVGLG